MSPKIWLHFRKHESSLTYVSDNLANWFRGQTSFINKIKKNIGNPSSNEFKEEIADYKFYCCLLCSLPQLLSMYHSSTIFTWRCGMNGNVYLCTTTRTRNLEPLLFLLLRFPLFFFLMPLSLVYPCVMLFTRLVV